MAYDAKDEGALFKNDRKQSDKHPDYTGSWVDSTGKEFYLSAWVNESGSGKKYMKLKLGSPKDEKPAAQATPFANASDDLEDLPF